ncbi:Mis6-domain-containing protein [Dactylonectria estremocensis]|uniref:Mis6-domain-containing protein n=1 Tax=Dactylonectria estremocensis TaxID=1079267 RepID=A0A9P9F3Y4_9HYPO|nr:Mis6-domain-containing protein [Dactylonectria estremocensis]
MASAHDEIRSLVRDVIEASKLPPKSRTESIKPKVASLTSLAYEWGVLPDTLLDLINLITTPSHLDQASLSAITRNLYPAEPLSRDVCLQVVSCLGHGKLKPSLVLQAGLLKWLIMGYHVLEYPQVLCQTYPVLFNLLDTAVTRPHLSHLLALVTRRKHVRPFRIQALLNLSRQTGNDPCLIGLLRVFKDYYPEVIVGQAVRGRASAFKHPDPQWRQRLDEIQEAHLQQSRDSASKPQDGFRVHRPVTRSQRNRLIPIVHTPHATEDSVTLEEIENTTGFVGSLEKIELPNQLVAVLADPLLQKLILLRPSDEADQRIANWLNSALQDVLDGDSEETVLFDVLDILRDYVVSSKKLPPLILNFFAQFLPLWNGSGRRDAMFEILSYSPLTEFQELYQHIFQPLENVTLDNTPASQLALLALYKNLLLHWTSILQSNDGVPEAATGIVAALIRHVNPLCLTLAQTSPTVSTRSAILEFYEQNVRLVSHDVLKQYIRIELPPPALVYILLFSNSLVLVSRMCNVLACYRKGFDVAMQTKARHNKSSRIDDATYNRAYVDLYNGFLMDICNCFWRGRAFTNSDTNALGCMVPRSLVPTLSTYVSSVDKTISLDSIFDLSYSPVLCLQSIRVVRELEDIRVENNRAIRIRHAGPVTQNSLTRLASSGGMSLTWKDYRVNVLATLSASELPGITELLKNTMKVVRGLMEAKAAQRLTR